MQCVFILSLASGNSFFLAVMVLIIGLHKLITLTVSFISIGHDIFLMFCFYMLVS